MGEKGGWGASQLAATPKQMKIGGVERVDSEWG